MIPDTSSDLGSLRDQFSNHAIFTQKDINTLHTLVVFLLKLILSGKNKLLRELIHIILTNKMIGEYVKGKSEREKSLNQFISVTGQFETTKECLAYLDYLNEHEFYDPKAEKVSLMTMHTAKGLEFEIVILCGFEEGLIPLARVGTDIDEEKRLLYVALTRAKKSLFLTHTQERKKNKSSVSPFLSFFRKMVVERGDLANGSNKKKREKWKNKKSQMTLF
jgi:superfamily I DNA/RNA helicase